VRIHVSCDCDALAVQDFSPRQRFVRRQDGSRRTDFEKANDITRFTSDKTWRGDFEGVSHIEMITGSTASTGSMAYVAVERVTGKLNGRQGSFTFSHRATMMKGDAPSAGDLSVTVVPNSGTGELTGLTGSLMIHIDAQGKHTWTFDYSLP
jgi:hypothetical protein